MLTRSHFLAGSLAAATSLRGATRAAQASAATALDRYVAADDGAYRYDLVRRLAGDGYTGYVLEMISQRWRDARVVDRPLWRHWLTIVVPATTTSRVGAVIISGGSNDDAPPSSVDPLLALLATTTNATVAELHMVPNQPLTFADEWRPRSEDDLIAYSWDKYLRTGDETWPLRLPMTKAVVRAMDTVTAFCRRERGLQVDRFVCGGTSKRGWTTWTTAAADPRVVGIIPVVIDTLNVEVSALHAYRAYGAWAEALRPYEEMGIMRWFGTPQLDALMAIEDPYAYRARLRMPKLIVNATGDQYFVPDSSQFYLRALPGENYLRYVPNTDHSLRGAVPDTAETGLAFLASVIDGATRPRLAWTLPPDGSIRVRTATQPTSVKLWRAHNAAARDFRLETIGKAFAAVPLRDAGGGTYVAPPPPRASGWTASFVELVYGGAGDHPFTVTTDVRVTPATLPFAAPAPLRARLSLRA